MMKLSAQHALLVRILPCWVFAVALFVWLSAPTPAWADGVVTDCSNYGQLSSFLPLGGSITFNCGGPATIVVTSTSPIATSVSIDGWNNGSPVTLSGNNARRVFSVSAGVTLNLYNLTVTAGRAVNGSGGNISNGGTLNLNNVTISQGHATTSIVGAGGLGGGIYNSGSGWLTVTHSTIYSNTATENPSTVGGSGGGIYSLGTLNVTNSTISGNSGDIDAVGGGIASEGGSTLLMNTTIANNSAGAGDNLDATGSVGVHNTIFAGGTSSGNCSGAFSSQGHNLSDDSSCVSLTGSGDITNTPALLGPLASNGGQTLNHLPQGGSPAINNGENISCPSDDQRGISRPQGGVCDIGSVEVLVVVVPASVSATNPISRAAGTAGFTLIVTGSNIMPGAAVHWNGSPRGTTFNSPNQLTASILASDLLSTGTVTISVQNPSAAVSNAVNFTVFEGSDTVSQCNEYDLDAALYNGGNITFTCAPATITVSGQKVIGFNTTISGGNQISISGGGTTGIFYVLAGKSLSISDLTLNNGHANIGSCSSDNAGAIFNAAGGTVSVSNVVFNHNIACSGGAIHNRGNLSVASSSFSNNSADSEGGAIHNYFGATANVSNSTFMSNTATGNGGAINNLYATLIAGSTFAANSASNGGAIGNAGLLSLLGSYLLANSATNGGGISNGSTGGVGIGATTFNRNSAGNNGGAVENAGQLYVIDSTFGANSAGNVGGGIDQSGSLTVTIQSSTFASNTAGLSGGSLYRNGLRVSITNTIVTNSTPQNCAGPQVSTSGGHNLDSGNTCLFLVGSDLRNLNPLLGALQDNGGPPAGAGGAYPMQTYALQSGSPAIDAGDNNGCPATDQRGVARPIDGNNDGVAVCDIGAYEAPVAPKQSQTITFNPLPDRILAESPFTLSATASSGLTVTFTASGACTVSGNSVTLTGLGTCTITAHQAGNAFYNAAADVPRPFKVIVKVFLPLVVR